MLALLDAAGCRTRSTRRWCAGSTTTRARCSSSRATRSARSPASAAAVATTCWPSSSAGRTCRASAGRRGSSGSCWRRASATGRRVPRRRLRRLDEGEPTAPPLFALVRGAARGTAWRAQMEQAGRSIKGQLKQANRIGAQRRRSSPATASWRVRDMDPGDQREVATRGGSHGDSRGVARPRMKAAAAERVPRHAGRARCAPTDVDDTRRVAGWVHRRRDHGGLIFIDVRDRTGLLQVVFHPEHADAHAAAHKLRARGRRLRRGRRRPRARRARSTRTSPTGEVELSARSIDLLADSETPPFEVVETGQRGVRGDAPALPLHRPAPRGDAEGDAAPPRRDAGDARAT